MNNKTIKDESDTADSLLYRNLEKNIVPIFITIKLTGQWQVHNIAQRNQKVDSAG